MTAKGIAVATCLIAVSAGAYALEAKLSVAPETVSPSSPVQWTLEGLRRAPAPSGGEEFVLDEARHGATEETDLLLGFDGSAPVDAMARWAVRRGAFERAAEPLARMGAGAASFRSGGGALLLDPRASRVFGSGASPLDFSLEFWTFPAVAENGEILLRWRSVRREAGLGAPRITTQSLSFSIVRDRPSWSLVDFFAPPSGVAVAAPVRIELAAASVLVPRTWSHHLLRFDSSTGLVEYLMNGRVEATAYATPSGREAAPGAGPSGRTVYMPLIGEAAPLEIAPSFAGLVDEFRITSNLTTKVGASRYGRKGGSALSPIMDLGAGMPTLKAVSARRRTPGGSGASFSYRLAPEAQGWTAEYPEWIPFDPDRDIPAGARGRYLQLRVDLYPDGTGEAAAAFGGFEVRYERDLTPPPPARLQALARDGAVLLRWTRVPDADLQGYAVYFGEAPGEYYGVSTTLGPGPLDAGSSLELLIDGLSNGTMYYFAVASYDEAGPRRAGEFSHEAAARPLRTPR